MMELHFNSIKVRLEHATAQSCGYALPHFNSIKVRLERSSAFVTRRRAKLFQFHKGAIRTVHKIQKNIQKNVDA